MRPISVSHEWPLCSSVTRLRESRWVGCLMCRSQTCAVIECTRLALDPWVRGIARQKHLAVLGPSQTDCEFSRDQIQRSTLLFTQKEP
jgi:hypothetical protein